MKNVSKFAVIVSVGMLLGASGLTAGTSSNEQAYVESYQSRGDMPVPLSVVSPDSASDALGQVDVQFVVNEKGKPTQLVVKSATDQVLVGPVLRAVSQWRFAPAQRDGAPVATTVVLPVRFKQAAE